MVATVGVLKYSLGMEVVRLLGQISSDEHGKGYYEIPNKEAVSSAYCKSVGMRIVCDNSNTVVFMSEKLSKERSVEICFIYIFPWLLKHSTLLFSAFEREALPPRTPLAHFVTPFES